MNVTIIGLGLIGGSMALDLRKAGIATKLMGIDQNPSNAKKALDLKLVDEVLPENEALSKADLVILAIPVNAICAFLPSVLDAVNKHTIVIDAGSTKKMICNSVTNHPRRNQFVASHPIAGTEFSGPEAAFNGLFENKTNIICEREKSSAEEHDKHVAYVSHLSHVSSFLLGQTVLDIEKDEKNIFDLAGSGFASTVRLAKSSPEMWTPIFEQNAEYLSQALLEYIMHLQKFQYHLQKRDAKELHKIMTKANDIKRILKS